MDADSIIRHLDLAPHPEGGYFRETYRSGETVGASALPDRYDGDRTFGTAIYFLLKGSQKSLFHRLASDEIWYFNLGCTAVIHIIRPDGEYEQTVIGPEVDAGENPQIVLRAGSWFGAEPTDPDGFILVSCSVSPGFEFSDFELADRASLSREFPQHEEIIHFLTSQP